MRILDVEARYDESRPEGGHVVVLLAGLEGLVDPVRFRLKPLDTLMDQDRLGELAEAQEAVAWRSVPGGSEIVIGPQTTAHPALETGSAVEIDIAGHDARGEMTWPAVTPLARPRRTGLVIKRAGMPRPAAASDTAAAATVQRETPRAAAAIIRPAPSGGPAVASRAPVSPADTESERPAAVAAVSAAARPAREPAAVKGKAGDYVEFYPHARGGSLKQAAQPDGRTRATLLPQTPAGAALTTAVAVLGLVWLVSATANAPKSLVATPAAAPAATPTMLAPRPQTDLASEHSLFDLLQPGAISPRGVPAKDVAPQRALELAQAALQAPGAGRDPEEGTFWLRRYAASIGGDERTRRALTQLGSAYADSSNKSFDFVRARQVWELASAFGDPVAMCFLGILHENGLAGTADRKIALGWFERAKSVGGCAGVDEAIARVK